MKSFEGEFILQYLLKKTLEKAFFFLILAIGLRAINSERVFPELQNCCQMEYSIYANKTKNSLPSFIEHLMLQLASLLSE